MAVRSFSLCTRPVCPSLRDGPNRRQLVHAARLDVAHPQSRTRRPCSNEIRNGRHHTQHPPIDVHPHPHIPPRNLASRLPRHLVKPPRDVRDPPSLPAWRRAHSSLIHAISFSPPAPQNTSVFARRGTRLLLLTLPLAAHGASTSSMHAVVSPAGGDHNVLSVAPYLVHVDLDALFPPDRYATFLPFVD